ncbi:MAG: outer membrane beta-barrel protein [Casimicrobiaceae bacterium]
MPLLLAGGAAAGAEPSPVAAEPAGFYGGVSLRDSGRESDGLSFGHLNSVWGRFSLPTTEDKGARTLAYGGYRWANDLAVEAAVASVDRYLLQPAVPGSRRGVGLALANDGDAAKIWNVDVYTSWEFRKSFSLYGRLGYAQSEAQPSYVQGFVGDVRRNRDGVNYGLGLRYDMSPALGLRLEYARFGRLPGEALTGTFPENDQLQLGVQYRF